MVAHAARDHSPCLFPSFRCPCLCSPLPDLHSACETASAASVSDSASSFWIWLDRARVHADPNSVPSHPYNLGLEFVVAEGQRCCRGIAPNTANILHIVPICLTPGVRRIDISTDPVLTSSLHEWRPKTSDLLNGVGSASRRSSGADLEGVCKGHVDEDTKRAGLAPSFVSTVALLLVKFWAKTARKSTRSTKIRINIQTMPEIKLLTHKQRSIQKVEYRIILKKTRFVAVHQVNLSPNPEGLREMTMSGTLKVRSTKLPI